MRTGVRKFGSFFCTMKKFDELSRPVAPSVSFALDPDQMRNHLKPLADYIQSKEVEILEGNWKLSEFIRRVSPEVWRFFAAAKPSPALFKRGRAVARVSNTSPESVWPLNPRDCPPDFSEVAPSEFTFALAVYFSIEHWLFESSNRLRRGPITTTISISALPNSTLTFHRVLNRIGCAMSYSTMVKWRNEVIRSREESGPFATLNPDSFVSVAVDNINMRAGHSLSIHGESYLGFDGLAVQGLNSNVSFNVRDYLK